MSDDLRSGFVQGFEEAKRRIAKAIERVETSWTAEPKPFAYEPPETGDRRPSDVKGECARIARDMKVPDTKVAD